MLQPAADTVSSKTRPVLTALRKLGGRATLGDVVAETGLPQNDVEASLRDLLEDRRGHLAVGEAGALVYSFDPRFIKRDAEPLWERIKRTAWSIFTKAFKVWIVLMLVVYFVLFVALLIAAIFANRDDDGGGWGGGGHRRHGHSHFPSFWFWYLVWTPDWRWGRPYYGHRWEDRLGGPEGKPKVPFYKKVFAFVFGPDEPKPTQEQKDRSVLRLIRSRKGVLTTAELVQHTGLPAHEAEEEMARLMATHGGDVKVSDEGVLTYVFPDLMVSAKGRVTERQPDPAWRRLEHPREVTGNTGGANALVAGINGFNLLAAATAPLFIFPRLGLSGDLAWIGLVWVPVAFSSIFFAVPLARRFSVLRENAKRAARNLRKVLLGKVFEASLAGDGAQPVRAGEATERVSSVLPAQQVRRSAVDGELVRLTAEFDGDVAPGETGEVEYRFPGIRRQFVAAERTRKELALEEQEVGEIVYSSEDDDVEASRRDMAEFDKALAEGRPAPELEEQIESGELELHRYLQAPNRVDYLDDFEVVSFEEELLRRGKLSR